MQCYTWYVICDDGMYWYVPHTAAIHVKNQEAASVWTESYSLALCAWKDLGRVKRRLYMYMCVHARIKKFEHMCVYVCVQTCKILCKCRYHSILDQSTIRQAQVLQLCACLSHLRTKNMQSKCYKRSFLIQHGMQILFACDWNTGWTRQEMTAQMVSWSNVEYVSCLLGDDI